MFSSKSPKTSSKKMFPFNDQLPVNNSSFFLTEKSAIVMFVFFRCYGQPLRPLLSDNIKWRHK